MVWLEYQYRDTFMHNLHPLTKVILVAFILVLSSLWWDYKYLMLLLAIAGLLCINAKVPKSWLIPIVIFIFGSLYYYILAGITQVNPDFFKVTPKELVNIGFVIEIPVVGWHVGITYGAILWIAANIIRIPLTVLATYTLLYTVSVADLMNLLRMLKVPEELTFALSVAYKLIPYVTREFNNIMTAQRLRGFEIVSRNPQKIAKGIMPLFIPLTQRAIGIIDQTTIAAKSRAFGSGKPTIVGKIKLTFHDKIIIVTATICFILALFFFIFYDAGMI
ncbi:MAG: energy-coupling factor transporter transmembrane component T [Candidatus Bathyarchaeia archaeon]